MIRFAKDHCKGCAHYQGDRKCKAFPDRIPDDLWAGDHLHRQPYDGDSGIRFEPRQQRPITLEDLGD